MPWDHLEYDQAGSLFCPFCGPTVCEKCQESERLTWLDSVIDEMEEAGVEPSFGEAAKDGYSRS